MPVYEYECLNGHKFEKLWLASAGRIASVKTPCKECELEAIRVISKTARPIIKGYREENGYSKK